MRLACERHLRDLERSDIEWCPEIGDSFVGFISHLRHIKGQPGAVQSDELVAASLVLSTIELVLRIVLLIDPVPHIFYRHLCRTRLCRELVPIALLYRGLRCASK